MSSKIATRRNKPNVKLKKASATVSKNTGATNSPPELAQPPDDSSHSTSSKTKSVTFVAPTKEDSSEALPNKKLEASPSSSKPELEGVASGQNTSTATTQNVKAGVKKASEVNFKDTSKNDDFRAESANTESADRFPLAVQTKRENDGIANKTIDTKPGTEKTNEAKILKEAETRPSVIPHVVITDNEDDRKAENSDEETPEDSAVDVTDELKRGSVDRTGSLQLISTAGPRALTMEPYIRQRPLWPPTGQHILAQYDNDSVVVYQAFKKEIAEYAVENQELGGPNFSFTRMSWIKTNFMWMMYRSGWATKKDQETVLAIRISRDGFDEILSKACTAKYEKEQTEKEEVVVRLQWDPDHGPNGAPEKRRAIQLGLRKEMLQKFAAEFIVSIADITKMVRQQHYYATEGSIVKLQTPRERVYHVDDEEIASRLQIVAWKDVEEVDQF